MASQLTQQEQDLVTHIEVYGMTVDRAGEVLGITAPREVIRRPHVRAAMDNAKQALRVSTRITKEDVVNGMVEAIEQAKLLGDPMAQIRGWSEIGKLHDYYSPKRVSVQLTGAITEVRKEIASMPDDELMASLIDEAEDVIDADFYRVTHDGEK